MVYLISRSINQGHGAGLISLIGIACGFVVYLVCAALGITALLIAVPYAYDALRICGACYLLFLAWQALKPGGRSPFHVQKLAKDSPHKLLMMGFLTSLLNPKVAVLYLSLLPQFIDPSRGDILKQSFVLGMTQIFVSVSVNTVICFMAGSISSFLISRPFWMNVQRWFMGSVLAVLAARMATDTSR
jgi:threonine/homoserine/homoserine lactone efflux protein